MPRFMIILQQHRPESNTCVEARVGSSRDSFRSRSSGSLLSLAAGEHLPPPGSPRLMVWFVAFADGKGLAWKEQDREGWPPTLYMVF